MAVANTITFVTSFDDALQARLNHPTNWKEMCDVTVTNARVISSSYMSTTPSVQTGTRGTGVALQTFIETAETLTVSVYKELGILLDLMDEAQSPWTKRAELFDRIGSLINEVVETAVLARHASWTNFGVGDITAGAVADSTAITVNASNIDDIIRGVKRVIRKANGQSRMKQYGVGFVWRPEDFEILEAFAQANGTMTADRFLIEGTLEGFQYLNVYHYWSNDYTAGHVMAGIRKQERLGIGQATYGAAHVIPFPAADSNTFFSGNALYSRIDYGHLTPSGYSATLLDVNVA